MTTEFERKRSESRLLRGYGPLLGWVTAFLAMVLLAPTVAPERVVQTRTIGVTGSGDDSGEVTTVGGSEGRAAASGVVSCPGEQIVGDPYSPPCRGWRAGANNGGATARGVSKDTITLAFRDFGTSADIGAT